MQKNSKYSRRYNNRKNGSLTTEMAVIIIGLVIGTVVLCWFLNTTFLEKYYTYNKQMTLMNGFHTINEASQNGELASAEFDITFDNLCANGNITIMVISSDRTIIRSSVNDNQTVLMEFLNILFGINQRDVSILKEEENVVIQKQKDTRLDSEYIVLYGTLSNGNLILMRSALESIRESAEISNKFLAYIGVLASIVSAIVVIFVSKGITTPIIELTNISKKMSELDFEAKYKRKRQRKNEIDELGEHVNRLSETLEHTISELKSANVELQKDIEKKIQMEEMRKEFLSNVSHELKTPLALIQGYAEGLQEGIDDTIENRQFYCEVIIDEANKMNQMVKKLLTLNQLEFGKQTISMERFDLTEMIHGVINATTILLEQNEITVEFMENQPLYVWGDEYMVEEVLMNYLSNAIHHAEDEKKIRITYTRKESCIRVHIFNTGKCIPEEDIAHIWDKFYKVDKARTREYGGNGIGLSIVKASMEAMNQTCGVCNHENGVEFWFELDTGSIG